MIAISGGQGPDGRVGDQMARPVPARQSTSALSGRVLGSQLRSSGEQEPLTLRRLAGSVRRLSTTTILIKESSVRTARAITVAAVLGLAVGIVVPLTGHSRAVGANPPPTCDHGALNTAAESGDGVHRGVRVNSPGMWIETMPSPDTYCARISSVEDASATLDTDVEVGWLDAPGQAAGTKDNVACGYKPTDRGPHFLWSLSNGSFYECNASLGVAVSPGTYKTFSVLDPNDDGIWHYYYDGTEQVSQSFPTFQYGVALSNGERHNVNDDIPWSEFNGLEWQGPNGYEPWSSTYSRVENDRPPYCNYIQSATHVFVQLTSDGCKSS